MAKIIGPGSLIVDITARAPHLPVMGETTTGSSLQFGPGGKGSNQMTAAHRAGAEALIIGKRGGDVLGQILAQHYASEGMSEKHVLIDPEGDTGNALIEVDEKSAQNRIIVILGPNTQVEAAQVLAAEPDFADCDAVLTQFETTIEAVLAAKALAQKYKKPFILNPAPHVDIPFSVFEGVDLVTPNETETEQFTGIYPKTEDDCRAAAQKFFSMGIKAVVITLGSKDAYDSDQTQEIRLPALKVKAVDTTGAGDAFNGALATAIAEGMPIDLALKFATCTSAISVTRPGAAPSMPCRDEILALLEAEFGLRI